MKMFVLMMALLIPATALAQRPLHSDEWTPLASQYLARSCVAEAGFDSADTGECAAIAWVYARRFHQMRSAGRYMSFSRVVWQYSSPLRLNRRSWVRHLSGDERPRGMPRAWPWESLLPKWQRVRAFVQEWSDGAVPNPCPGANHFGSVQDGAPPDWTPIRCNFRPRNRFWRSF